MAKKAAEVIEIAPDKRKLTGTQAARLAGLTGIEPRQIAGSTVAELSERLKWRIDPERLLFRKICGKVVKTDAATGAEYPVPFATVHVEDTDCSLVAYFPRTRPWGWFYPIRCRREELATVKTDKCGNFCVWVPRFDIDWILHWRTQRICFPEIFTRPSIKDLLRLERYEPVSRRPFPSGPGPDPGPLSKLPSAPIAQALGGEAGQRLARRVTEQQQSAGFGSAAMSIGAAADERAFDGELPPPLPEEFRRVLAGRVDVGTRPERDPQQAIRSAVALQAGVDVKLLATFDIGHYVGPFFRCVDILLPEWQLIVDTPDITFRVTQDTNGDGTEETIYSEGFFDVRWNAGAIPDVKLVASAIARESHFCATPDVPCGNVPAILFAGLMPLTDPAYFDASAGYALRPNRPIPPSGPRPPAETPFLQTLQLYGCVNVAGTHFYRVLLSSDNGASFSAITGLQWNIYPLPLGAPVTVAADSDGWYPVLANPDDFHPARMLLEWPTPSAGKFVLKVETGDAAKHHIQDSATVAIQTDNHAPSVIFNTLRWKFSSEPDSAFNLAGRDLLVTCPTIRRGVLPQDIDVEFEATVMAAHLRDSRIYVTTCAGGDVAPLLSPAPHSSHWHEDVTDNSEFLHGRYRIALTDHEGAYTFGCGANSRAINPSGGDGGHLADWFYEYVYAYTQPEIRVAIVNA